MGPNFFIWMAIGVVIVATVPALYGHDWSIWIGYPLALALAVFNKVRAIRRRNAKTLRTFN
jgi:hypothetical protein